MPDREETLIERLIPGDLEHQIPQAVEKVLPGGFKNRLIQIALGLLLAFGLKAIVRRWVESRERRRAVAAPPQRRALSSGFAPAPREAPQSMPERIVAAVRGDEAADAEGYHPLLGQPQVMLAGPVDQIMYANFRNQLVNARGPGPLVVSVSTYGGDPEVARLMVDELRLLQETTGVDALFLGKVSVYSAGTIVMAAFPPEKRYLTRGTRILVHERSIGFGVSGTISAIAVTLRTTLDEIEHYTEVDKSVYRDLIAGSKVTMEEIVERAPSNWYIDAEEARELGLIRAVI